MKSRWHHIYRRITYGASRLQEINVDRVATGVYGAEVLERDPRCAEALAGRSRVFHTQGWTDLASADFRAATAIEPLLDSSQPGVMAELLASPGSEG